MHKTTQARSSKLRGILAPDWIGLFPPWRDGPGSPDTSASTVVGGYAYRTGRLESGQGHGAVGPERFPSWFTSTKFERRALSQAQQAPPWSDNVSGCYLDARSCPKHRRALDHVSRPNATKVLVASHTYSPWAPPTLLSSSWSSCHHARVSSIRAPPTLSLVRSSGRRVPSPLYPLGRRRCLWHSWRRRPLQSSCPPLSSCRPLSSWRRLERGGRPYSK